MSDTKLIRVLVLYGGRSGEHEVSLRSAASVVKNLDPSKFEIIPVGIDKSGIWHLVNPSLVLGKDLDVLPLPANSPRGQLESANGASKPSLVNLDSRASINSVDVVFPVMHGPFCEDGSVQGLCEMAGVAYVGAGVLGSAIGMDKDVAKRLVEHAGMPMVPYICVREAEFHSNFEKTAELTSLNLGYPVFVKPANLGSSVGVSKVIHPTKLKEALQDAFRFDRKVLIEKGLNAREIEVSVLESLKPGEAPLTSVVGEIKPTHDFYSYEAKYLDDNGATLHIPASISAPQAEETRRLAARIFQVLELDGMARADFFLDRDSGKIFFNEVNTIPGFTTISMYPKLWEASGLSYQSLLTHLVELALKRHKQRKSTN